MGLEVWTVSSVLLGTELIVLLPTVRTPLQHVHQKGAYTVGIFTVQLVHPCHSRAQRVQVDIDLCQACLQPGVENNQGLLAG